MRGGDGNIMRRRAANLRGARGGTVGGNGETAARDDGRSGGGRGSTRERGSGSTVGSEFGRWVGVLMKMLDAR